MKRPYDTSYYRRLVHRLRSAVSDIAITTDIIVGFPGETQSDFEDTLAFAEEMAFSRTHIFSYSPRQRTFAAQNLLDNVDGSQKNERHKALSAACTRSQIAFAEKKIGRTVDVLVEGRGKTAKLMSGYTGDYLRVQFDTSMLPVNPIGQIVKVRIDRILDDGEAMGRLATPEGFVI